jgi:PAS domain S-box-containing protein
MSWVTIVWSMVSAACLTLSGIYLLVWWKQRKELVHLVFSCCAVGAAGWVGCELGMMRADTPAQFGAVLRWAHVPTWVIVVSLAGFVRLYLRAGHRWLAWSVCGLRTLALILNFVFTPNLNYREITSLRHLSWWGGETVSVPVGVTNPWTLIGQLSLLLLLALCVDATIAVWRRGEHRRALAFGGTMSFFMFVGAGQAILVFWGLLPAPFFVGFAFLGIVAAMAYELSYDVLRAAELARNFGENEKRMKLATQAANMGIWIRDLKRNEIWASDGWRVLLGFDPTEKLTLENFFQRVHPEDREPLRHALEHEMASDGHYERDYRVVLPDGRLRWIASRGQAEFDSEGRPAIVRGVSLDITARKQAESEMMLLRQEIAHVSRVTTMGQLASALAHEINQPLGAILRNAEAAELFLQHKSPDLEEIRAILADIRKDDRRASAVIDRMRTLLRRRELETQALDVAELIGDVAAVTRPDATAHRVRLEVEIPAGLPRVRGDRVHLQQVLLNLIVNGMDAVNGTATDERCVTVRARPDGEQVVEIAVSDSGSGVPDGQLAHVFDPFFTTKPSGMGMGLAISRTIVEAHGGRLWAENNAGRGATFCFTLKTAEVTFGT